MSSTNSDQNGNRLDYLATIEETRLAVWRLLHYAVSDANKDITNERPDIIQKVLPAFKKPSQELHDIDVANLLLAYNDLSLLVYPASIESLWLKEQVEQDERRIVLGTLDKTLKSSSQQVRDSYTYLKRLLYSIGIVFLVFQAYTFFLSDALETIEKQKAELVSVEDKIASARATNKDYPEYDYPLSSFIIQKRQVVLEMTSGYCILRKSSFVWGWMYPGAGIDCGNDQAKQPEKHQAISVADNQAKPQSPVNAGQPAKPQEAPGSENKNAEAKIAALDQALIESQENATRESFFAGAKTVLRISNYLILPMLLGSLGSLAYVIRELLKSFCNASFIIGMRRRGAMRIVLGPLLGLISGIVISPDSHVFKEVSFSPLILGFLMGYSVEFSFSVFDSLIAKGKSLLPDGIVPPKAEGNRIDALVPYVNKLEPNQGPASGGTEIKITGSGFTRDVKVSFGTTPAAITKIAETEITAISPPGQGVVDVTVLTQAGYSPTNTQGQYTYIGTADDTREAAANSDQTADVPVSDTDVQAEAEAPEENLPAAEAGIAEKGGV